MSATAAQRRYWTALVRDGCLCCGGLAEIAHAHGGSIVERMGEPKAKGRKLERMNWLVLPLCPRHGRDPYPGALDSNVDEWEREYGPQSAFIDTLAVKHGVDLWALAKAHPERRRRKICKVVPRQRVAFDAAH